MQAEQRQRCPQDSMQQEENRDETALSLCRCNRCRQHCANGNVRV